ncbi:type IV secretion system protein [Bartonella sp. ML71XJBT]|uniref:type IV secretion system protein n=2 Tax=Bartonella sp. ML71XJBT TaxID=3019094 RepID=UPI00235F7E06|nr:type IV secretion system protein [Bartonella sp. ML71XJBT]
MKKTVISIVIATILGMQNTILKASGLFSLREGPERPLSTVEQIYRNDAILQAFAEFEERERQRKLREEAKKKLEAQKKAQENEKMLLDLIKNHLEKTNEIYSSISGTRTKSKQIREDDGELFFLNPQLIYDNNKQTELGTKIPQLVKKMIKDENYLRDSTVQDAREEIDERSQYAAIISKAISLHIFQEIENRFEKIAEMLLTLDKMTDLKGVEEMKMRMNGMLAMIQNESTKLQMVIHSHDIEKTLIQRLKRKRNVQILGSVNKQMPTIR